MSNAEAGGNSVAPQAANPWDALKNVSFGGASATVESDRATNKAEAAANKAEAKYEAKINNVSNAENKVKATSDSLNDFTQKYDDLKAESAAKFEEMDNLRENISTNKTEIKELKAENRFSGYIKQQGEQAGAILRAGGGVVAAAFKRFTTGIVARMPRIEINISIQNKSREKMANKTWDDYEKEASDKYKAEAPDRENAQGAVDKEAAAENELKARKNSFQEAIETFRRNRGDRLERNAGIKDAKNKLRENKRNLADTQERLVKLDSKLADSKEKLDKANAEYQKAEESLNEAKSKAEAAEKVAKERALEYDRAQTLARFKAELGDRSVAEVRNEIMTDKKAYERVMKSFKKEMFDQDAVDSIMKEFDEKLNALDVYENEIGEKATSNIKMAEAPAVEAEPEEVEAESEAAVEPVVAEAEPEAAVEPETVEAEPKPAARYSFFRPGGFNFYRNLDDEEEKKRGLRPAA